MTGAYRPGVGNRPAEHPQVSARRPLVVPAEQIAAGCPPDPAPRDDRELTEAQQRVLQLIAEGHGNDAIGRRLHLAEDTIKTHARRLYQRLGARSRAHAVHLAHQRGLL